MKILTEYIEKVIKSVDKIVNIMNRDPTFLGLLKSQFYCQFYMMCDIRSILLVE